MFITYVELRFSHPLLTYLLATKQLKLLKVLKFQSVT